MSEPVNRRNAILAVGAVAATAGMVAAQKVQFSTEEIEPAEAANTPTNNTPPPELKLQIRLTDDQTIEMNAAHVVITFPDGGNLAVSPSGAMPVPTAGQMRAADQKARRS